MSSSLQSTINGSHSVNTDAITNAASRRLFGAEGSFAMTAEELRRQLQSNVAVTISFTAAFTTLAAAEAAQATLAAGNATAFETELLALLITDLAALGKGYLPTGVTSNGATLQSVTAAQAVAVTTPAPELLPNPEPVTSTGASAPSPSPSSNANGHHGPVLAALATVVAMMATYLL